MPDRDIEPNDPLGPYDPSSVPRIPGNGRTWFALLLTFLLLSSGVYTMVSVLLGW